MTKKGVTVLVIEDELAIRRLLKLTLGNSGYIYREAENANEGLSKAVNEKPDLIILDLGLPDMDGLELTRQLRACTKVPIIILSAREKERDKVEALDQGADDYLTKPFGVPELLARLRVALRHAASIESGHETAQVSFANIRVESASRRVFVDNREVKLTKTEFKLLLTLIKFSSRVVTYGQLLKEIWGQDYEHENSYLRVYMANLRRKLEKNPSAPKYLITVPGVGYRLKMDDLHSS